MQKQPVKPSVQCDACHHEVEMTVIEKQHVGMPCPVCETEMISAADYSAWRRFMRWRRIDAFLRGLFGTTKLYSVSVADGRIRFWGSQ